MTAILLELLCVASLVAFCIITWWPAALLVIALAAGYAAWNRSRQAKR